MALPLNIKELIHGRIVEWERIEFKAGWNPLKTLHTICAFANDLNNWGGGYIILGIKEEKGKPILPPVGLSLEQIDRIQKELVEICHKLQPHYFPIVEPVNFQNRMILIIWAPGGPVRPYKAPERFQRHAAFIPFIRRYSVTKKANAEEERELFSMANQVPFDDQVNHKANITDLNLTLIQAHLAEINSGLLSESSKLPFPDLCRRMEIVEGPDEYLKPKNIGLLLFSEHPERFFRGARIDIVEFEDEVGDRFTEKIFTGPLPHQIKTALQYIKNSVIAETIQKVPGQAEAIRFFNYPYEAVEEALVNAVYHRSYQDESPVEVRIFPGRIEILSYPGPMPPLNKDNLNTGKVTARKYRNRRIGDFFKELNLTEGRNTGFPKIKKALAANGSPPALYETDEERIYFLSIFKIHPRAHSEAHDEAHVEAYDEAHVQADDKVYVNLSKTQELILLECLKQPISFGEITQILGHKSRSGSLKKAIAELMKNKLIRYTLPDKPKSKNQRYQITETGAVIIKHTKINQ